MGFWLQVIFSTGPSGVIGWPVENRYRRRMLIQGKIVTIPALAKPRFCTVFRSDLVRYIPGFSWSSIKSRYRVRISWADNLAILSSTKHNPRNHMASRNKAFIKQLLKHIWYTKLHVLLIWSFTLNIKSLAIFSRRFLHIYIKNVKICDMYTTDFTFSIRSWHPLQSTLSIYCTTEWFPFNIFGLCW